MARFSLGEVPVKQQILLFALLLVGCGYLFYSYYIQPLRETSSALDGQVQTLEVQVERARLVETQLPKFRAEVQKQQARLKQFRATLPSAKETPQLMRSIHELAVGTNLRITSFTPQKTIQKDFYVDWPIEMAMQGNFHNLAAFFEKVGRLQRLVNIGEVTIRGLPESTGPDLTIDATCTATTFVYREDENDTELEKSGDE